jgi:hypothetical protein
MQANIREMQRPGTMKKTLLALKKRLLSPITILGWSVSSLVLAIMGPFNTYAVQPFGERLLFWSGVILLGITLATFIQISVRKAFPKWPMFTMTVVAWAVFTALQWLLVCIIVNKVYGHLGLPLYSLIFLIIAGVGATIFTTVYLVSPETLLHDGLSPDEAEQNSRSPSPPRPVPAPSSATKDAPANPFLAQLGPDAGEKLIRLAMRDHYIEVYTEVGQKLVHMRFGDAVSQLDTQNGARVHRSHWISFDEIREVVKEGDKLYFRMSDGALVPISRSRKPELKKRGLI